MAHAGRDVWGLVHAERSALIDDLDGLTDEQWDEPSLCGDWTIHDVVAHLVGSARETRLGFAKGLLLARFDFDRMNQKSVVRERRADPKDTLARLREVAPRTTAWNIGSGDAPPERVDGRLVEEVVHGEDIRRPLGIVRDYPQESVVRALRLHAKTPQSFGGAKELLTRVRAVATDADLTIGEGAEVRGPVLSLLLALSGRDAALAELDGPGVPTLARPASK